jgi:pimeloyl-ACP methyl ester carboxylesterase
LRISFTLAGGTIAALDNAAVLPGRNPSGLVLMVPGYTGSKEDFMPLLRPLAGARLAVVAIDQRGQYQSQWARSPAGYTLSALADEVCQLAAELASSGIALHLLGHSFGGLVSRSAMLDAPELFTDLVLMGSGPAGIGGQRRQMLDIGEAILAEHGMAGLWELMQSRGRADPRYVPPAPALQTFLQARFLATDPVGLQIMGQTLREETDRTVELAALGKPVLVLHGVDDDAWPPRVQADMATRLGAAYVVIERAAHSPAVENPAGTASALIEFWQRSQA